MKRDSGAWKPLLVLVTLLVFLAINVPSISIEHILLWAGGSVVVLGVIAVPGIFQRARTSIRSDRSIGAYIKPKVTGARITTAILFGRRVHVGELDVESSHSQHVSRQLSLPTSSWITTVKRNQEYKVRFELYAHMFPFPDGVTQQDIDRWTVQEIAVANGYQGKIETS